MAKWVNSNVLTQGLNYIPANVNEVRLVSAYTANDGYSTINTNTICKATITSSTTPVSANGTGQQIVTTAASNTAIANGTASHIVFMKYDSVTPTNSIILWVTPETSGTAVNSSDTVNFPSGITLSFPQPT